MVFPTFISLTCGQDVTVPTLVGVTSLIFGCQPFNGSEPFIFDILKDNVSVSDTFMHTIANPDDDAFGTYAFLLSTEKCGADLVVSRILQQGQLFKLK